MANKFKSVEWQSERRRAEQFFNARVIMFRVDVSRGSFEAANKTYDALVKVMDEMILLAGAEK